MNDPYFFRSLILGEINYCFEYKTNPNIHPDLWFRDKRLSWDGTYATCNVYFNRLISTFYKYDYHIHAAKMDVPNKLIQPLAEDVRKTFPLKTFFLKDTEIREHILYRNLCLYQLKVWTECKNLTPTAFDIAAASVDNPFGLHLDNQQVLDLMIVRFRELDIKSRPFLPEDFDDYFNFTAFIETIGGL